MEHDSLADTGKLNKSYVGTVQYTYVAAEQLSYKATLECLKVHLFVGIHGKI